MSLFERAFNGVFKPEEKQQPKKKTICSTAGAVPVKNAKGEITMEKVKVKRYVAGKAPEYAMDSSGQGEDIANEKLEYEAYFEETPRSQQQQQHRVHSDHGRRIVFEPRIIHTGEKPDFEEERLSSSMPMTPPSEEEGATGDDDNDDDDDETNIAARRQELKERLLKKDKEEVFAISYSCTQQQGDDGFGAQNEAESDEEEVEVGDEYLESEDETIPRLKPVFVPKGERVTVAEESENLEKLNEEKELEEVKKRRKETKELVAEILKEEIIREQNLEGEDDIVITDDDDEETAFEAWKVRELKRIKREVEEAESRESERREIERLRLMTEEERQAALLANPKIITNYAQKGEYKFLQKYYHRGAFYLDVEDNVLKQNFAEPTLEDHFDKLVLPKVMQVKKFGMAGRTKYTHLVDQDTSSFDGAWSKKNELAGVFANKIGGGMKQEFARPSNKRKGA